MQKGAKIFSADGTTIQVAKVEKKKANKSLELERLGQSGLEELRFEDVGKMQIDHKLGSGRPFVSCLRLKLKVNQS